MSEPVQTQSYLLLFSIGPVQGFIETARKAQDLWAGSFLLSRLVEQAATKASGEGAKVIFPAIKLVEQAATEASTKASEESAKVIFPAIEHKASGSAAALPNHLLLHLETGWNPDRIRDLATTLGDSVRATFSCMITHGMQQLKGKGQVEDISSRQIQDFLEISWAAVPLDLDQYGDSFSRVEGALAGRKRIRIFKQIEPELSLKCSLCGERQALHPPGKGNIAATRAFWRGLRSQGFAEGEYLCAICLGKRFAPLWFSKKNWTSQQRFPSTAEVAASPFRARVNQKCPTELKGFETEAVKMFGKTGCQRPLEKGTAESWPDAVDAHWFFPENLEDSAIEKELGKDTNGSVIREKLKALNEAAGVHPSRYFAVLMMDGDRMGRILGRIGTIEEHEELSGQLAGFASSKAVELVENGNYAGRLVYSGGDDLLAFVAVEHLLPLMEEIRKAFAGILKKTFPARARGEKFTMSAGACIGHYKAPLRFVLKAARSMLALAKSPRGGNRNAFALSLLRHSGSQEEAWAGWGPDENPLVPDLVNFSGYLKAGTLSDRFLYNLRREFAPLIGDDGKLLGLGRSVYAVDPLKAELKRLILRASNPVDPKDKVVMAETAAYILEKTVERDMHARNFFSLLSIVNMISRETIS